ncbi:Sec-independent protein translocase TatB [Alkalibaculum sp. M08DMB]|uniref:Sec-independent protein translocase TatB n=1 Tax=Alkalibaculum sporogenes TaxID=2655001 RepID=A0A6A7KCA7_9FIRM|nr:twin-arginine translocase TatA/TatE family subunit [Alkalibaculum sporogenes]MPW27026.1 Sec-independent protein translocase TatB [Alkalibaculum sporogenes]
MKIGTTELLLILVVGLFVLGPEKMPIYAKKVGKFISSLKGYAGKLSEDINENILEPIEEVKKPLKDMTEPFTNIKKDINKPFEEIKKTITDINNPKSKVKEEKNTTDIETKVLEEDKNNISDDDFGQETVSE